MRHFWTLPTALRVALVLAAQRPFSVNDDLLAYPQFKVQWLDDYVTDAFADTKLGRHRNHGRTVVDEAHLDRYQPPPISKDDDASYNADSDDEHDYELVTIHKQKFLCTIPRIPAEEDDASTPTNETMLAQQREEEAKELVRAGERGWELLKGMQGHCVYYVSGWWSYSFCFENSVKQFHALAPTRGIPMYPPQEDTSVKGFVLGTYDKQAKPAYTGETGVATKQGGGQEGTSLPGELVTKGESRYLVQRLEGGTLCDLTGKSRKVEIQYHCNPSVNIDRISLIKELSTCSYLMVIQTPRLCSDVAFLPPQQDVPNDIICKPVLKQDEVDDYVKELAAIEETLASKEKIDVNTVSPDLATREEMLNDMTMEELVDLLTKETSDMQIVGDVIIGGHSIVPEDMILEKSAIVGGGKTIYIDTVADSDGKTISKAEMEKLGYGDIRAVDKLTKEMKQMAKGRPWKLDIVDTPRGREYRGYIDQKAEEEAKKGNKEGDESPSDDSNNEQQEGSQEEFFFPRDEL